MTTGQLSIFDALAELDAEATGLTTCPRCHWTWDGPRNLDKHLEGSDGWVFGGSKYGRCENQQIALYQLGSQVHFGDRPTYRTDLLGAILHAKQRGCTDQQIAAVLPHLKGQS